MKKVDTFLYKNMSLNYFSKGLKLAGSVRQRLEDEGSRHRLAEYFYIDPYLLNHIDSIIKALHPCFLDERFSTRVWRWPLSPVPGGTQGSFCPVLIVTPAGWLWLCDWWSDVGIYNIITPKRSGCGSFDLLLLVNPRELSSCLHSWNIVPEISDWQLCQKSICNKSQLVPRQRSPH